MFYCFFFFFSSRRRHTRLQGDWSSDVCSSDLQVWRRQLGTPVSRGALSCGDIDPLGITGTPVIDEAKGTIYLDAAVSAPGGPAHQVFALSLANGMTLPGWPVDVGNALRAKGFVARDQNERGAL